MMNPVPEASSNRTVPFIALNLAFCSLVAIGQSMGNAANPRSLYLVLLFAVCSSTLIDFDKLNGRHALSAIFSVVYLVSYGLGDLTELFRGNLPSAHPSVFSETEAVIVVGGVLWNVGFRIAVSLATSTRAARTPRDWPKTTIVVLGLALWAVGTYATFMWSVIIVPDTTNEAFRKGIHSIGTLAASAYILGQMMQPVGLLLLAYALYAFRNRFLLPLVVALVVLQVALGFVVDIKGMAMLGGILVILSCVMVTGKVPKVWVAAGILFVIFVFPIFTAYRTAVHGDRGIARTAVIENFGKILQLTLAAETRVNTGRDRAQSFFERASLKGSTQMIVEKTGNGVDFQQGHTMSPILATFIPKILWSDKPDVPTGQLVNKQFHVSDSDDVYISPSHLGELYWNFGWPGVVIGMTLIGLICGYVGGRCNMSQVVTVTRLLVLVITARQLIVGFEGALSSAYVVWLRSLAAVGILHLLFARRQASLPNRALEAPAQRPADAVPLFPHLLR